MNIIPPVFRGSRPILPCCDESEFIRAHGHAPRGSGTWVFAMDPVAGAKHTFRGTYRQAREQAAKAFLGKCGNFYVLP